VTFLTPESGAGQKLAMAEYRFITIWRVTAPVREVYQAIYHSSAWPSWWKGIETVVALEPGDELGVGGLQRYTWRSRLPYRLTFDMRITRVVPVVALEGVASGDLEGTGRWEFSEDGPVTTICYKWFVRTNKHWMNWLAPIARPLFNWNHEMVMRDGAVGLARMLNARLLTVAHR